MWDVPISRRDSACIIWRNGWQCSMAVSIIMWTMDLYWKQVSLSDGASETENVMKSLWIWRGNMIKILIADDQELIRQSLSIILGNEKDFEVTDTVTNGVEVVRSVRKNRPDVILMDIRMPEMDGVVCTQIIKENYPDIKIIILTTFDDDEYVFNALKNGASGYLLKGVSMKELSEAVRKVHEGTAMINGDIASKVVKLFSRMAQTNITIRVDESSVADLKEMEWRIIALVGSGLSNREIAAKINLSEGTVRNSLSVILSKLNLRDRTQLAIWAVQTGAVNRIFDH